MKRSVIVVLVILAAAFAIAYRAKTADTKLEEQNKAIVQVFRVGGRRRFRSPRQAL